MIMDQILQLDHPFPGAPSLLNFFCIESSQFAGITAFVTEELPMIHQTIKDIRFHRSL